jgi:hypothetical protein
MFYYGSIAADMGNSKSFDRNPVFSAVEVTRMCRQPVSPRTPQVISRESRFTGVALSCGRIRVMLVALAASAGREALVKCSQRLSPPCYNIKLPCYNSDCTCRV